MQGDAQRGSAGCRLIPNALSRSIQDGDGGIQRKSCQVDLAFAWVGKDADGRAVSVIHLVDCCPGERFACFASLFINDRERHNVSEYK